MFRLNCWYLAAWAGAAVTGDEGRITWTAQYDILLDSEGTSK